MKISLVNFFYDEAFRSEEELLEKYYTLTGWAEALQRQGAEVTVISRFAKNANFLKNGVSYFFIKDHLPGHFSGRRLPLKFLRQIAEVDAHVVHMHHFTLSIQTWLLRRMLDKKTAMIIQHHGGKSPSGWKMRLHNKINNLADAYFFTAYEQGEAWFDNDRQRNKVLPVMEGGSFFNFSTRDIDRLLSYRDRALARQKTGMQGDPVFLWVGRLDSNKDPITVFDGFKILLEKHPAAQLYFIYGENELEEKLKDALGKNVHLLGKIPHNQLEEYYHSADYFVLGSHYEGSCYALSEALSCGCIPVITHIPSFRTMTDNGKLASLWKPGDAESFARAADEAIKKPIELEANKCIDFYKCELSYDAIATKALEHYQTAISRRLKKINR